MQKLQAALALRPFICMVWLLGTFLECYDVLVRLEIIAGCLTQDLVSRTWIRFGHIWFQIISLCSSTLTMWHVTRQSLLLACGCSMFGLFVLRTTVSCYTSFTLILRAWWLLLVLCFVFVFFIVSFLLPMQSNFHSDPRHAAVSAFHNQITSLFLPW